MGKIAEKKIRENNRKIKETRITELNKIKAKTFWLFESHFVSNRSPQSCSGLLNRLQFHSISSAVDVQVYNKAHTKCEWLQLTVADEVAANKKQSKKEKKENNEINSKCTPTAITKELWAFLYCSN